MPTRTHELIQAQMAERHALDVLHFEQQRVVKARRALQDAQFDEAKAMENHRAAAAAREALERPDVTA